MYVKGIQYCSPNVRPGRLTVAPAVSSLSLVQSAAASITVEKPRNLRENKKS